MSLIKNRKKAKKIFKKINNFTTAKIEVDSSRLKLGRCKLILDGNFKMVLIKHNRELQILKTNYSGLSIIYNNEDIVITNYHKNILKDDVLFEFLGILDIRFCKVYRWGQQSSLAQIENNLETKINKDDNLLNSNYLIGKNDSDAFLSKEEDLIEYEKIQQKVLDSNMQENIIKELHTKGGKFLLNNKIYIGTYHYHINNNMYMTGSTHTPESQVLKKIAKLRPRRKYGI